MKKISILGLGLSGLQSALFLKSKGFNLFVSDSGSTEIIRERAEMLRKGGIEAEFGRHSQSRIFDSDWVLISPGIPPTAPIVQSVKQKKVPIYSEIEIASRYCSSQNIIAVTGSAGKTTVTTLITRVLRQKGFHAVSCGNIGNPWIGELSNIGREDFVVLELSSFQLEHCESFHPKVGVLLNISPNHQDWHANMEEYVTAKLRLFQNQTSADYAVLREADQSRFFPASNFRAQTVYFDQKKNINPNDEVVRIVTGIFDCETELVDHVLQHFEGIEHRLERVTVSGGVTYINDSKSTTPASLAWALEKFLDARVVLLAGGHPKSTDFHLIRDLIRRKVKRAVLIGEARPLLREAWQGCAMREADNFKDAIVLAQQAAESGDTVLLSPACASFDMFRNYEERGMLFKKIVHELTSSLTPI